MKAEHRKELQTNILADRVGRALKDLRSSPSLSLGVVGFFVVLAVGLVVALVWARSYENEKNSQRWNTLAEDLTPSVARYEENTGDEKIADERKTPEERMVEALKTFSDKESNEGTIPAQAARFKRARVKLATGLEYLCSNREGALKDLEEAQAEYDRLAEEGIEVPSLIQEALMGSGTAREARGDLDGAQRYYERLASTYPNSFLGKEAKKRAELLSNDKTRLEIRDFYAALEKEAAAEAERRKAGLGFDHPPIPGRPPFPR